MYMKVVAERAVHMSRKLNINLIAWQQIRQQIRQQQQRQQQQ